MANLQYTSEIIDHGLFRASELIDGTSDYESQALIFLNKGYRALYMGGSEFVPKSNEVWWWMKDTGNLILQSSIKTGTVSVTQNNSAVTFSAAITPDLSDGWYLKISDHADVFQISSHGGSSDSATLDSVYTGSTNTAASYRLMKLEYDLASSAIKPIAKMRTYQDSRYKVEGISETRFDDEYPLNL